MSDHFKELLFRSVDRSRNLSRSPLDPDFCNLPAILQYSITGSS
jgi:hypothetical protein